MTSKLHLASGLELPIDVVTQKLAFLGRTGSGKTYGATKLAELMLSNNAQIVALDPVGVWYGLRIGADFRLPVFGGLHGDIALESTAGAVLADLVVDRGISAVLDVSHFETDTQKARFAEAFASRFFFRKKAAPAAVHLFLEECQEFVPQNPQGGDAQMLHAFTRLAKLGRNFGIGLSLISQRPQEINKKVLNMSEVMLAFQMRGPQERKTIKDWSSDKDLEVDIVAELPSLAVGEAFVSSPQWLQIEKRVKIAKKLTADVSSTPTMGATSTAVARELTPIDLAQLQKTMAATIEKAKAEDPKELQKRIRELEAENRKLVGAGAKPGVIAGPVIEQQIRAAVDVALHGERQRQDRLRRILRTSIASIGGQLKNAVRHLVEGEQSIDGLLETIDQDWMPAPAGTSPSTSGASRATAAAAAERPVAVAPARPRRAVTSAEGADISRPQQRMLNALATMHELTDGQMERVPRNVIAALSDQSPRSSGWEKNLSTLRSKGLISYPDAGTVSLTPEGAANAMADASITSIADLHASWKNIVSGPQWRMLQALIAVYPDAMDRAALAAESEQSSNSSGWEKNLSTLRSLGVLAYPSSTEAVATEFLFPRGLV